MPKTEKHQITPLSQVFERAHTGRVKNLHGLTRKNGVDFGLGFVSVV